MEICITWENKTVYNKEIDVKKVAIKTLKYAGLITIGSVLLSNTFGQTITAFAEPLPDALRPTVTTDLMDGILNIIEYPEMLYTGTLEGIGQTTDALLREVTKSIPY